MAELSCTKAADPDKVYNYFMIKNLKCLVFSQISTKFMAGKFIAYCFVI